MPKLWGQNQRSNRLIAKDKLVLMLIYFVKLIAFMSFLMAFTLFSVTALAQVQFYGMDIFIDKEGVSSVNITITYAKPEAKFQSTVIGRIRNFQAKDIDGPINCSLDVSGISNINCNLNLTKEKRSIEMSFETNDFVKTLENKFFFSNDFGLNRNITNVHSSIRLAEGFAISDPEKTISFPESVTTISDGRRIILVWKMKDVRADERLKFEFLYEQLPGFLPFVFRLRYIAVFGAAVATVFGIIWLRYFRKPENLVLSVLDDFERKVMDIIVANNGVANQKKIVQETNLSKAKISRVVKSLVERGLLEIERTGRTNKLKLVKKKFQF